MGLPGASRRPQPGRGEEGTASGQEPTQPGPCPQAIVGAPQEGPRGNGASPAAPTTGPSAWPGVGLGAATPKPSGPFPVCFHSTHVHTYLCTYTHTCTPLTHTLTNMCKLMDAYSRNAIKYMHTHTCIHSHTCTPIHVHTHLYTCTHSSPHITCSHAQIHTLMHTHIHTHLCVHTHTLVHMHSYRHGHTHSCIHVHSHTLTHTTQVPHGRAQSSVHGPGGEGVPGSGGC